MSQFFQKKSGSKHDVANSQLKRLGTRQKKMDNTSSRGFPIRQVLRYDLTRDCPLFDDVDLQDIENMKY